MLCCLIRICRKKPRVCLIVSRPLYKKRIRSFMPVTGRRPELYEELNRYAPVTGVYGNVDGEDMKEIVPARQLITLAGYSIGVVHGHGEGKTTEKRALEAFAEQPPDLLIYGHSHIPVLRYFKKTLLFNPGSVTDKRWLPYYSFGLLTIGEEGIHAEHIFFR